jgi:hypothetical protein
MTGIYSMKVNYVFDADLRRFLDRDSYCPQVHAG